MLGGSGGDMLNMGFDMRIPSGGGHGGGNAMRQSLQGQQHQMGGQLGGLNMGMGHQQMKGHSGGGMMHNSNTLNLMGESKAHSNSRAITLRSSLFSHDSNNAVASSVRPALRLGFDFLSAVTTNLTILLRT